MPHRKALMPLLQDCYPVTFASRTLTPVKQHYDSIKYEMPACVFGVEQFHTYVFGDASIVESDHKALEQIILKNLEDAPVYIQ